MGITWNSFRQLSHCPKESGMVLLNYYEYPGNNCGHEMRITFLFVKETSAWFIVVNGFDLTNCEGKILLACPGEYSQVAFTATEISACNCKTKYSFSLCGSVVRTFFTVFTFTKQYSLMLDASCFVPNSNCYCCTFRTVHMYIYIPHLSSMCVWFCLKKRLFFLIGCIIVFVDEIRVVLFTAYALL